MIELRGVVAAPGAAPVSAVIRAGEVVRLTGPFAPALAEVLVGRRRARAGVVVWQGVASAVLVRATDRLPGLAPDAALRLCAALAGRGVSTARRPAPADPEAAAASRGLVIAPALWVVDGRLGEAAEAIVQAAAEQVRAGRGAIAWTDGDPRRLRADRALAAPAGPVGDLTTPAGAAPPTRASARGQGRAIAAFVASAAGARGALGLAAVAAVWVALVAWTVAAHEGFWYVSGAPDALAVVVPPAAVGVAALVALAAAARAAATPSWPAMLRDAGASPGRAAATAVLGDLGGVLPACSVGFVPVAWARAAPLIGATPLLAALVAIVVARGLRGGAPGAVGGALGGAASALILAC